MRKSEKSSHKSVCVSESLREDRGANFRRVASTNSSHEDDLSEVIVMKQAGVVNEALVVSLRVDVSHKAGWRNDDAGRRCALFVNGGR